ncbi:MAG: hypothetical protein ABIH36_01095 [bacterium]
MDWNKWVAALVVVAGILGAVRAAKADPHAMFYTAIGQQQLFYNVLAALDQADYVETQFSREELVKARGEEKATPPFKDEEFPLTEATKVGQETVSETDPGIADLLMRSITLEGTDQYNDELVREFGAESGRRNATSELLRALCDYGLGFKDCENDKTGMTPAQIAEAEDYRRGAVVRDPLEWNMRPITDGVLAAFSSGTEADKQERLRRFSKPEGERMPMAYSPTIAKWRKEILNDAYKTKLLDKVLIDVASTYVPPDFEFPYKNFKISTAPGSYGETVVDCAPKSASDPPEFDCLENTASNVLFAPMIMQEIATKAYDRIAAQQKMMEEQGLLADVTLKSSEYGLPGESSVPSTGNPEELSVVVKNPVAVRTGEVYSLPNALAMLDTSQQASSLAGLDKPGSQQLVERSGSSSSSPTCNCVSPGDPDYDPSLPLCQTGDPQCNVLGTLNLFDPGKYERYDKEKEPTSPSANLIAGHLEQGAVHALRVLTAGNFRKTTGVPTCGYTCY